MIFYIFRGRQLVFCYIKVQVTQTKRLDKHNLFTRAKSNDLYVTKILKIKTHKTSGNNHKRKKTLTLDSFEAEYL